AAGHNFPVLDCRRRPRKEEARELRCDIRTRGGGEVPGPPFSARTAIALPEGRCRRAYQQKRRKSPDTDGSDGTWQAGPGTRDHRYSRVGQRWPDRLFVPARLPGGFHCTTKYGARFATCVRPDGELGARMG